MKKQLKAEGLFDISLKKEIPRYPHKIGIITSAEGAALRDIIQVLDRRAPYVKCCIYPVSVQGKSASNQISKAIEDMNSIRGIDVLIIGRGGGSLQDLWCFNEEIVVRAIHQSKLPIISGIGHETDITLSDYVADYRAPTPSAAAEIAAVSQEEILQQLDHFQNDLESLIYLKINIYIMLYDSS